MFNYLLIEKVNAPIDKEDTYTQGAALLEIPEKKSNLILVSFEI